MKKMTTRKKKSTIVSLVILALVFSLVTLPTLNGVKADLTWHPYITASPNPVGVDQRVLVVFGFTMPTSTIQYSFRDWTLTITDPDGNTQTATGLNTETTGSTFYVFTPDKAGNWSIKAHYPGGYVLLGGFIGSENVSVPAIDTDKFNLQVQQELIPQLPSTPLPSSYWEFPIYGENQAWASIAGNWLMSGYDGDRSFDAGAGAFNPYTTMPNTAHILWTKPQLIGGIVGGQTEMTYYTGSSYRRELMPPVIINGRVYYNVQEPPAHGFYCVNLATGETIWKQNSTFPDSMGGVVQGRAAGITLGQVLTLETANWHGGIPFLWSAGYAGGGPVSAPADTWAVWNAYDGNLLFTVANPIAGGTFLIDNSTGTLLYCIVDTSKDRIILWNSTKMLDVATGSFMGGGIGTFFGVNPKYNLDWNAGVQLNATIPHIQLPSTTYSDQTIFDPKDPSLVIVNTMASGGAQAGQPFQDIAFSLKDGHMLWNKTRDIGGTWEGVVGGTAISVSDDCYAIFRKETRQIYVYSVSTGEQKWVSEPRSSVWGIFMQGMTFAYGKLYAIGYDGMVYAYDAKTGHELWTWGPVNAGLETPYGVYPLYGGITVADHKLIVQNGEHSANSPLYRGECMYVIDADNGTTVWSIDGWYQQPCAVAGIVIAPNGYDGNIYCFGKGPSATTVTAPSLGVTTATSITISGTVMDVSAGASQSAVAKNFPNGLPCVSDESQSQWMSHVYQQQPLPLNTTGVKVTLSVLDSNSNYREIGTTTSTPSGTFDFTWTPDIPGHYAVYASFAGSNSYYPSSAQTAFYASEVATPAPTQQIQAGLATIADILTYFAAGVIAIIIAIAIVAVLLLRKRP
jgi:hypothetical protein